MNKQTDYVKRSDVINLITRRYPCPDTCIAEINRIPAADVLAPPCATDTNIYYHVPHGKEIICEKINKITIVLLNNEEPKYIFETDTLEFGHEDIGKDVFLSEEQAKATLK